MKKVYCGVNETNEQFERTCYVMTTIHPAGLGVLFALVGWLLFHLAPLVCIVGGVVMLAIISGLNRRSVKRFRAIRKYYHAGVLS